MENEKLIRLNKYLSHADIGTRRECDQLIIEGFVTVNGLLIDKPGVKINIKDIVTFKGDIVQPEKKVYILLNKPKKTSCFKTDDKAIKSIYYLTYPFSEKLNLGYRPDIKPLDIVDIDEKGLIVLTNDVIVQNNFKKKNNNVEKVFKLILDNELNTQDYITINESIDEILDIVFLDEVDKSIIGIKTFATNEIINNVFKDLSYNIEDLDRTYFGFLTKKDLPRGKWRFLNVTEVSKLKGLNS